MGHELDANGGRPRPAFGTVDGMLAVNPMCLPAYNRLVALMEVNSDRKFFIYLAFLLKIMIALYFQCSNYNGWLRPGLAWLPSDPASAWPIGAAQGVGVGDVSRPLHDPHAEGGAAQQRDPWQVSQDCPLHARRGALEAGQLLEQSRHGLSVYLNQESLALRSHSVSCFSASSLATP